MKRTPRATGDTPEPATHLRVEWLAWLVQVRGGAWVERRGRDPVGWYSFSQWRARRVAEQGPGAEPQDGD